MNACDDTSQKQLNVLIRIGNTRILRIFSHIYLCFSMLSNHIALWLCHIQLCRGHIAVMLKIIGFKVLYSKDTVQ